MTYRGNWARIHFPLDNGRVLYYSSFSVITPEFQFFPWRSTRRSYRSYLFISTLQGVFVRVSFVCSVAIIFRDLIPMNHALHRARYPGDQYPYARPHVGLITTSITYL